MTMSSPSTLINTYEGGGGGSCTEKLLNQQHSHTGYRRLLRKHLIFRFECNTSATILNFEYALNIYIFLLRTNEDEDVDGVVKKRLNIHHHQHNDRHAEFLFIEFEGEPARENVWC